MLAGLASLPWERLSALETRSPIPFWPSRSWRFPEYVLPWRMEGPHDRIER